MLNSQVDFNSPPYDKNTGRSATCTPEHVRGKKEDIRDVLLPAIEKRRSSESALRRLEPTALARQVVKSKYIRGLVDDLLNGDIKRLENLCTTNFPGPAATVSAWARPGRLTVVVTVVVTTLLLLLFWLGVLAPF